jgi:hyperosmotically inducible periplasmic protein
MNPKTSHKIIAVGGMVAVIAIGVVMFATRSHPASSIEETAAPPPPVAQASDAAADAAAPMAAVPAAVAPTAAEPAAVSGDEGVGATTSAVKPTASVLGPKSAPSRSMARAGSSAVVSSGTLTPSGPAAGMSGESAPETTGNRVERLGSADVLAPPPIPSNSPADDPKFGASSVLTTSDSQITTDVKAAIAGDLVAKDSIIGVSTTDGVVALTGSVASQSVIDQVKDVAGKVKDVKSVDASALILASL